MDMIPVVAKDSNRVIGYVWFSDGEWQAEHSATGVSWACDSQTDAEEMVRSQE